MYDVVRLGKNTLYMKGPGNIGVYEMGGGDVCLIDTGFSAEAGGKILEKLTDAGKHVSCVIGTHAHPDHIGGCKYIAEHTGCRVLMHGVERAVARWSELQMIHLYGGFPYSNMRNGVIAAESIEEIGEASGAMPQGLEMFELPGHFLDMIGVRTDDGVCFIADSIFGIRAIEKLHLLYIYDVARFLETLSTLGHMTAQVFVPAHSAPLTDLTPVIAANRKMVDDIAAVLLDICASREQYGYILKEVFIRLGLDKLMHHGLGDAEDHNEYFIIGSTVRSYLSWLHDTGRLSIEITRQGEMFFTAR